MPEDGGTPTRRNRLAPRLLTANELDFAHLRLEKEPAVAEGWAEIGQPNRVRIEPSEERLSDPRRIARATSVGADKGLSMTPCTAIESGT
jgi:hypothetical protein